jgi:hypothetical protein
VITVTSVQLLAPTMDGILANGARTKSTERIEMSHYSRVEQLVRFSRSYDWVALKDLIENTPAEDLADDIAYVLSELFSHFSEHETPKVINDIVGGVVDFEFKQMRLEFQ